MSNQVEKFQENFRSVVESTAYLLDDVKFKEDHGFSFAEYVTKGNLNDLTGFFNLVLFLLRNISLNLKFIARKMVWI